MRKFMHWIITTAVVAASGAGASAQDRVFARTYQSNVLNKGNYDLEIWNTYRFGRDDYYARLQQRFEFEFGVTNRLQTAFYLNTDQASAFDPAGGDVAHGSTSVSFSNEWKYKFSDPVANAAGCALYGEYTLSSSEIELEAKLILDKRIGSEQFAFNLTGEAEFEAEAEPEQDNAELENEHNQVLVDVAWMHLTKKGFGLGLEVENRNGFESGDWRYATLHAGPTFSYHASGTWWLILNVLPQVADLKAETGDHLELTENEKFDVRLLFAFVF